MWIGSKDFDRRGLAFSESFIVGTGDGGGLGGNESFEGRYVSRVDRRLRGDARIRELQQQV